MNTLANSITLVAEDDITVSDLLAVDFVNVQSTVGSSSMTELRPRDYRQAVLFSLQQSISVQQSYHAD